MPKLSQIIAIEKGVKTASYSKLSEAHKKLQKPALLAGIARTYRSKDDDGDQLPPESTRVQMRAEQAIEETSEALSDLFNVTAAKDWGNCEAKANVVIDGQVLMENVPIPYLLFLEKQLVDLKTFIEKLPVLDQAEDWHFDENQNCWATEPVETTRNKKVPRNHIKYEATKEHPAQVEVYNEDVVVGYWRTVKFSGALPASRVHQLMQRVENLQRAVKFAREEANSTDVSRKQTGDAFFAYLFAS